MSAPTPADQLNDAIDRATDQASQAASQASTGLTEAATTFGNAVGSVDPASGAVITAAGPVLGGVLQGQADLTGGLVDAASASATGYANAAGDVASGYADAGGDLVNTVGQAVNDQVTAYSNAGSDLLDGFEHGNPLSGLLNAGGDLVVGDVKQVGHILTGVAGAAADVGTGIFHGIEDVAGGLAPAAGDVVSGVVKDFEDVGHGVLEGAAHGLKSLFGGGESKGEILKKFGHEDPEAVAASRDAAAHGKADLAHLASAINSGDTAAVGTAEELLKPGESGLAYFSYFLPAYDAWTGRSLTEDQLRTAYEQEFGMNFTAYASDAELMDQVATSLNGDEQSLQNAYNALVPTWQGPAAANFEAKLSVFFAGASATQQAVSDAGAEVKALVEGLQKLILAKAETVNSLYADTLDPGIDAAMAQAIVKVAQGQLHDDMRRVVLGIFHLAAHGRHGWDDDGYYSADCLDDPSRQAAINAATAWCNNTLMPQTEARLKALSEACTQTQQRIQQAFAKLVEDLTAVKDPFAGMTTATAPLATSPEPGGAGTGVAGAGGPAIPSTGAGGGGGAPSAGGPGGGSSFTPPPSPTYPTSTATIGATAPQGVGSSPTPAIPTVGGDPQHDIHKNTDGSVSLGEDRGLTISPEKGEKGIFTLTDSDPDGTVHTYHVHFDQQGNPVVTEVGATDRLASPGDITAPAGQLTGGGAGGGGAGGGGADGGGISGSGGAGGGTSGAVAAGTAAAAHAGHANSPDLAQGAQVASDNTMGAASTPAQGSPVAGSAGGAAEQSGGHQGGAIGGMPMGAGMGRGAGGQGQEAARKYQQRGDVVGEEDLEDWQRMGPVIGEQ